MAITKNSKTHSTVSRIAYYPINVIFEFIEKNPELSVEYYIDSRGNKAKLRRARIFHEIGLECVKCPVKAAYFALDVWKDNSLHLDLFGIDSEGDEVMITIDHIHAKSKGGKDQINNYQPMCKVCNEEKADK